MPYLEWTNDEVELLVQSYSRGVDLRKVFPNRTYSSITHKASRLGLKRLELENVCGKCGDPLDENNWYETNRKKKNRICKKCTIIQSGSSRRSNRDRSRKWYQQNYLHTTGATVLCKKRPKTDKCELCCEKPPKAYHHWGNAVDGKMIPGIWVCHRCHQFAEVFDKGLSNRYDSEKRKILNANSIN